MRLKGMIVYVQISFGSNDWYKHLINTIKVFRFTGILGGDSRCNRYEVEEHPAEDDEEEIRDMDRKHSDFKRSEAMNHT